MISGNNNKRNSRDGDHPNDSKEYQNSAALLPSSPSTQGVTFNFQETRSHCHQQRRDSHSMVKQQQNQHQQQLDFIGSTSAVNDIFALSRNRDVDVAVAVHNIGGGVLLLDGADLSCSNLNENETQRNRDHARTHERGTRRRRRRRRQETESEVQVQPLPPLPSLTSTSSQNENQRALTLCEMNNNITFNNTNINQNNVLVLRPNQPNQNYNNTRESIHQSYAQAVRKSVNNDIQQPNQQQQSNQQHRLQQFNASMHQHVDSLALQIIPDYQHSNQQGGRTHDIISPLSSIMPPSFIESHARDYGLAITPFQNNNNKLIPVTTLTTSSTSSSLSFPPSPSCIILDSYLDNIVQHVPQLGQYFKNSNVMQGIDNLQTHSVPMLPSSPSQLNNVNLDSIMLNETMTSSTTTTSNKTTKFAQQYLHGNDDVHDNDDDDDDDDDNDSTKKHDISPDLIESNAANLLHFLKTNCFRENSTYLLQRSAGQSDIQLYDITSLSTQRHRKWMWWLAMTSYRFGLRLKQLMEDDQIKKSIEECRNFRQRIRGLMDTSLELLHEVADMDGMTHETICAAIFEHIADTYLYVDHFDLQKGHDGDIQQTRRDDGDDRRRRKKKQTTSTSTSSSSTSHSSSFFRPSYFTEYQLYSKVSIDALGKAQDNLIKGILELQPTLSKGFPNSNHNSSIDTMNDMEIEISNQMYKLHHKLIHVTQRLAERHLENYWSSSAMQALRLSARKIVDAVKILQKSGVFNEEVSMKEFKNSLLHQIGVLRFDCANFARSFAADEMWRERGGTSGEDVIALLRDVELSVGYVCHYLQHLTLDNLSDIPKPSVKINIPYPSLSIRSGGKVGNLHYLSGIVPLVDGKVDMDSDSKSCPNVERANWILEKQKLIARERRRVLVASSICYSHACDIFATIAAYEDNDTECFNKPYIDSMMHVNEQRLGDTCNEIGSIMLKEIRKLLQSSTSSSAVLPLLLSSEFWFLEALTNFKACKDKMNEALLLCNLSQCSKIHAKSGIHQDEAEKYLEQSAKHLELAHETLEQKDEINSCIWDKVSLELANAFLILGVTRRHTPVRIGHSSGPGMERSIVHPIQRAIDIYSSLRDEHQFAAANYQLALFYAKTWKHQRSEDKTREKLTLAFKHFTIAHQYFFSNLEANESTFVLLSLDIADLYASISGIENALDYCLKTSIAFSPDSINESKRRGDSQWFERMNDIVSRVEDLILNLLLNRAKLFPNNGTMKKMYGFALTSVRNIKDSNEQTEYFTIYKVLKGLESMNETKKV